MQRLFLLTSVIVLISSEKILFFYPIASHSHSNVFQSLVKGLADRGHLLTVVTPIRSNPETRVNIREIIPIPLKDVVKEWKDPFQIRKKGKTFWLTSFNSSQILSLCESVFDNIEFQGIINEKYDLVIMNGFLNNCFDGILPKIGAPFIWITSLPAPSWHTEFTGNYLPPSFVPNQFLGYSDQMTFRQRVTTFIYDLLFKLIFYTLYKSKYEGLFKSKLGQDTPGMEEINRNVSLILMNSHFSLTYPRPNLPDNVEVGGMHCRQPKPLPKELEDFISEGGEHGFIYFSFGSIIQAHKMPQEYKRVFLNTFRNMKQRVIWKWESSEEIQDLPLNVKLSKWLPQQDLLGHPNIKLFITHGGLLSTQEAVYHGVPILGIPLFGDQDLNMIHAESQGYALTLEILETSQTDFKHKLDKLLTDPSFKRRAKELSTIFRDQIQTPLERAIYWSEYVIRHKGTRHLHSAARDLNYFQIYSYDVIGFLVFIFVSLILVILFICRKVYSILLSIFSKKKYKANHKKVN